MSLLYANYTLNPLCLSAALLIVIVLPDDCMPCIHTCRGKLGFLLPSREMVEAIESAAWLQGIRAKWRFIPCHDLSFGWRHIMELQAQLSAAQQSSSGTALPV